jgi:hypothetical protein
MKPFKFHIRGMVEFQPLRDKEVTFPKILKHPPEAVI